VTLAQFLLRLAADPELAERFRRDPLGVADEYGVSREKLKLLQTGQIENIRVEVRGDLVLGDDERAAVIWIHKLEGIIWLFDGGGGESA
jgi:hypothetical protein